MLAKACSSCATGADPWSVVLDMGTSGDHVFDSLQLRSSSECRVPHTSTHCNPPEIMVTECWGATRPMTIGSCTSGGAPTTPGFTGGFKKRCNRVKNKEYQVRIYSRTSRCYLEMLFELVSPVALNIDIFVLDIVTRCMFPCTHPPPPPFSGCAHWERNRQAATSWSRGRGGRVASSGVAARGSGYIPTPAARGSGTLRIFKSGECGRRALHALL